jgi:ABC-type polysaccharide/polyol phosphate export permease
VIISGPIGVALADFTTGLRQWRVWTVLALSEIKGRYRRSLIGQFWLTISLAITVACLGIVYSAVFRMDIAVYLPLMAISFICWGLLASLVNESTSVWIESENYIKSSPLPRSIFIFKYIFRGLICFAHNLVLVPIIMLIFGIKPTAAVLLFIPALIITVANGLSLAVLVGIFCARYRDMAQIVGSAVQIAFFVSPVIWSRAQLKPEHSYLVDLNPFAAFLEILRLPLLGQVPDLYYWLIVIGITVVGGCLALPFYARFRSRIPYYL